MGYVCCNQTWCHPHMAWLQSPFQRWKVGSQDIQEKFPNEIWPLDIQEDSKGGPSEERLHQVCAILSVHHHTGHGVLLACMDPSFSQFGSILVRW